MSGNEKRREFLLSEKEFWLRRMNVREQDMKEVMDEIEKIKNRLFRINQELEVLNPKTEEVY